MYALLHLPTDHSSDYRQIGLGQYEAHGRADCAPLWLRGGAGTRPIELLAEDETESVGDVRGALQFTGRQGLSSSTPASQQSINLPFFSFTSGPL